MTETSFTFNMPDRQLTIAKYAAGAGLAAIALVYVFGPTFVIDGDGSSAASRKRGVVGLLNSANDCFINSVVQALAGLGDLRVYLIREVHRRNLDGVRVYRIPVDDPARQDVPAWKLEGLQRGIVTRGLKEILDALNERPLYKKTISPTPFIRVLEAAFRQRISRQQQDAQEFLQVVAERLGDEYHAGHRARQRARGIQAPDAASKSLSAIDENVLDQELGRLPQAKNATEGFEIDPEQIPPLTPPNIGGDSPVELQNQGREIMEEEGFPMEGKSESRIECLTCGFKPKPTSTTFCTLTLNVPQVSSTTLNACFDGMFKTEYIDDFKCEKCRLVHAMEDFQEQLKKSNSEKTTVATQHAIDSLRSAIETDPEDAPADVELPDSRFAPKRRIARHVKITKFPKILAIHLSRSIFDVGKSSMKNSAKVQFPEQLPLGSLLHNKKYKLLSVVMHKGSHHSGHYESFRRQNIYPPFSNPNTIDKTGVYSKPSTPTISVATTPQVGAVSHREGTSTPSTPELLSPTSLPSSSRASLASSLSAPPTRPNSDTQTPQTNGRSKLYPHVEASPGPTSAPRDPEASSIRSTTRSAKSTLHKVPSSSSSNPSKPESPGYSPSSKKAGSMQDTPSISPRSKSTTTMLNGLSRPRKQKVSNRWWRISDDKVKESKTSEVLSMQREVYLLFYELERGEDA